ncbi:hypothetical protein THOM_2721 [Trachipleistophora hominis]|uniref:Uncharacterized protein n=1 Tax=Trachipleistophora hominis TaxID=72359 RepID=L7JSA1_TRAHO|nr:hypothetical protein THOM_2721 [Trachipleistophora hominis]
MNIKFAVRLVILSLGMIKGASNEEECKSKEMSMLVTAENAKHSLNQKVQLPLWDCSKDVISTTVSEFTYRAIGLRMMEADLLFKRVNVCAAVNDPSGRT